MPICQLDNVEINRRAVADWAADGQKDEGFIQILMKKKILGGIAFAAVALTIAFNLNISKSNNLSLLSMNGIEAMASSESSDDLFTPTTIYCKITMGDNVWWETGIGCPAGKAPCTAAKCPSDPY